MPQAVLFSILAGLCFSGIGFAYRFAQGRGIGTPIVVLYMAVVGFIFFAARILLGPALGAVPVRVLILGVCSGISQYATIKLCGWALQRGPLSPLWCAVNLVFVPVIFYAMFFLNEPIHLGKGLGIFLAICSVICASLGKPTGAEPGKSARLDYVAILLGALLCNSVMHGSVKDLGSRPFDASHSLLDLFTNHYLMLAYGCMGLPIMIDLFVTRETRTFHRVAIATGALAALGSIGGFMLVSAAASAPAAIVTTLSALLSLVGGSLISVLYFKEKATGPWFAMMGLAVGATVLVGLTR